MEIMAGEYRLRQFTADDINSFYELAHDELVKKYVPFVYPRNLEDAKEMVKNYLDGDCKNDFYLLIQKDETMVGMIVAVRTSGRTLDVSAFVSENYRGKGIMTIAMNSFINWLCNNTDYEKMIMFIDKENIASNCQIKKIGGKYKRVHENSNVYEILLREAN